MLIITSRESLCSVIGHRLRYLDLSASDLRWIVAHLADLVEREAYTSKCLYGTDWQDPWDAVFCADLSLESMVAALRAEQVDSPAYCIAILCNQQDSWWERAAVRSTFAPWETLEEAVQAMDDLPELRANIGIIDQYGYLVDPELISAARYANTLGGRAK